MRRTIVTAAGLACLAVVVPLAAQPIDTGSGTRTTTEGDCTGGSDNSLEAVHPLLLWPPNHKYYGDRPNQDLYFLAEGDEGEQITLTTWGTHDQYVDDDGNELNGSGSTTEDARPREDGLSKGADWTPTTPVYVEEGTGSVRTDWLVRAERAGTGVRSGVPNRTYTLEALAEFGDGGTCTVEIEIVVPHDMGKGTGNGKKDPVR